MWVWVWVWVRGCMGGCVGDCVGVSVHTFAPAVSFALLCVSVPVV